MSVDDLGKVVADVEGILPRWWIGGETAFAPSWPGDDRRTPLEGGDRDVVGATDVGGGEGHAVTIDIVGISGCLDHRDAVIALRRRVVNVAQGDHQPGDHRSRHAADLPAAFAHLLVALRFGGISYQRSFRGAEALEVVVVLASHRSRLRVKPPSTGHVAPGFCVTTYDAGHRLPLTQNLLAAAVPPDSAAMSDMESK